MEKEWIYHKFLNKNFISEQY